MYGRYEWSIASFGGATTPGWKLTAGDVGAPRGYRMAATFRPPGTGALLGRPEAMSFASVVYTFWRRDGDTR